MDIFLGEPPANVKQWIIDHATPPGPVVHTETRFTLQDGTVEEYSINGVLNLDWMVANGFYEGNDEEGHWVKIITSVDIGTTVTLGYFAFVGCTNLTTITIPDSITNYDDYSESFLGCENINSVTIVANGGNAENVKQMMIDNGVPSNITWNMPEPAGHADTWYKYEGDTEWRTVSITGAIIPDPEADDSPTAQIPDVSEIAALEIGTNVTEIKGGGFIWCYRLIDATIPNTVTSIGGQAFSGCNSLTSMTFEGKDRATVQGMSNYPFGLDDGSNVNDITIHCTDGDIQISYEG